MRTTLDLPDALMRSIKVRAAKTDRTLTEVVADLLRAGLRESTSQEPPAHRVEFPLVLTPASASAAALSPERISEILLASDVDDLAG